MAMVCGISSIAIAFIVRQNKNWIGRDRQITARRHPVKLRRQPETPRLTRAHQIFSFAHCDAHRNTGGALLAKVSPMRDGFPRPLKYAGQ